MRAILQQKFTKVSLRLCLLNICLNIQAYNVHPKD